MYQTQGLAKHRIFLKTANFSNVCKPKTSFVKERVLPEIQYKDLLNFRFSQTQQKFFAVQNLEYKNKMTKKITPNTAVKLKLLRVKKRTVSKCILGIGYEVVQQSQKQNCKFSQYFFPQRQLSIFKKLAFKNSNSKTQVQKINYKTNNQNQKQNQKDKKRLATQQTSIEQRNLNSQVQIKINSLGNTFAIQSGPCSTANLLKVRGAKNRLQKKLSLQNINQVEGIERNMEVLTPWDFQDQNNIQALQLPNF